MMNRMLCFSQRNMLHIYCSVIWCIVCFSLSVSHHMLFSIMMMRIPAVIVIVVVNRTTGKICKALRTKAETWCKHTDQ